MVAESAVNPRSFTLELLAERFAIARLRADSDVPAWAEGGPLVSVTRTPFELSVVCAEAAVPLEVNAQRAFRCLRVLGPLAFSETGVLSSLAQPLARAGVSLFALSTYDTDYLLLADTDLEAGVLALGEAGHVIRVHGEKS